MRRKPCTVAPKSQCFGHDPRVAELAATLFEDEFLDTSDDDSPVEALAHALTVAFEDWAFEYESAHPKCTGCNKRRVLEGQLCELCASLSRPKPAPHVTPGVDMVKLAASLCGFRPNGGKE